jgi:hypothetical protein
MNKARLSWPPAWSGRVLGPVTGAVAMLLVAVLLATAAPGRTAEAAVGSPSGQGIGPVADWMEELLRVLREIRDRLNEANGGTSIEANLVATELLIDQILDPWQIPTLTPADAGSIDEQLAPGTLKEYAAVTLELAEEALTVAVVDGDHEVIGSNIRTIRSLLSGYRHAAGL